MAPCRRSLPARTILTLLAGSALAAIGGLGGCGGKTTGPSVHVPAAPTFLLGWALSTDRIHLSWVDNAGNEEGFRVERSPGGTTAFAGIATVAANVTTCDDSTGLSPATRYSYRVRAFNEAGASTYSNTVTLSTRDTIPAPPSHLSAVAVSSRHVTLGWTDNATNEQGFEVERNLGLIATLPPNTTAYEDTVGVSPGTSYNYRVRAVNSGGASAYSNVAAVTTPLGRQLTIVNDAARDFEGNQVVQVKISTTSSFSRSDFLTGDPALCFGVAGPSIPAAQSRTFIITGGDDYYVFLGMGTWARDPECPPAAPWSKVRGYVDPGNTQWYVYAVVHVTGHAGGNRNLTVAGSYLTNVLTVTPDGEASILFTLSTRDPIP